MHDPLRLSDPDERDLAAGEYVLGTLTREQRAEFEALLVLSPELQHQVEAWRERLQTFNDALEPVSPPAHVWSRLAARMGLRRHWWQRLGVWRGFSLFASSVAIVLAVIAFVPRDDDMMPGDYVYVIQAENQAPGWIVSASLDGTMRIQTVAPGPMPAGKGCELWMMDNGQPVSLGMLPTEGHATMQLPPRMLAQLGNANMAVSLEPSTGSPQGKPTGPVMDHGQLTPIQGRTVSF